MQTAKMFIRITGDNPDDDIVLCRIADVSSFHTEQRTMSSDPVTIICMRSGKEYVTRVPIHELEQALGVINKE